MTQTSPKSSDQNTNNGYKNGTNGHTNNDIFDPNFGSQLEPTQIDSSLKQNTFAKPESTRAPMMPQDMQKLSKWQRTSLRTKMTLAALAIGVLPVALIGAIAYNLADREIVRVSV